MYRVALIRPSHGTRAKFGRLENKIRHRQNPSAPSSDSPPAHAVELAGCPRPNDCSSAFGAHGARTRQLHRHSGCRGRGSSKFPSPALRYNAALERYLCRSARATWGPRHFSAWAGACFTPCSLVTFRLHRMNAVLQFGDCVKVMLLCKCFALRMICFSHIPN